jgi:hypothetical protein
MRPDEASPSEPPPRLIFDWVLKEGRLWRLLLWSALVLLTGTSISLVFNVVYPAARQRPLMPQRALLLDGSTAESQYLINSLNDRHFLIFGESLAAKLGPRLADVPLVFRPTFQGYELRVKDVLESKTLAPPLPRLFRPNSPLLPPVAQGATPLPERPRERRFTLMPVLLPAKTERPVRHLTPIDGVAAEGDELVYRLAINPQGRVLSLVPATDYAASAAIYHLVRGSLIQLQFSPIKSAGIEWRSLRLQWKEEPLP